MTEKPTEGPAAPRIDPAMLRRLATVVRARRHAFVKLRVGQPDRGSR